MLDELNVKYLSTRGHADRKRFCDILLEGLAPDGGCTCPSTTRRSTTPRSLAPGHEQGYAELAFEILSLYIDDIPPPTCGPVPRPTPPRSSARRDRAAAPAGRRPVLEGLSNGPTLAFKDMAMQLLGNLFEYELAAAARAQHPGRHQRRHRQRGRIRHARQAGVRVFMPARTAA
jgi:threonine synthase